MSRKAAATRGRVTLDRAYRASLEDVWAMWTTKEGIESWWGPDGFVVEVRRIELRPGGEMEYAMIAVGAPQVEYMKKAGMPLRVEHRLTYTEIVPCARLAYVHAADFIPGVAAYDVATVVELQAVGDSVRLVLTFDAMHDAHWTKMAVMGWESELEKLAEALRKV